MDTYGKRLEAALGKKDRKWLAGKIGVSEQALSQVILGKTKALKAHNHELAVAALGCSGMWLATGIGEMDSRNAEWPFKMVTPSQYAQLSGEFKRYLENSIAGEWMRTQEENASNS